MVKFIRNLFLYWRYKFAFYRCDKLNENRKKDLCIVINLGNRPMVINRVGFLRARYKGLFKRTIKWEDIYQKRLTRKIFENGVSK